MEQTMLIKGMTVKRALLVLAFVGLAGCDNPPAKNNASATDSKPSISEMIANWTEEKTSQCTKGGVSLNCEFLSGDLLGAGKWHYAKVFISKDGKVDVTVDAERFVSAGSNSYFHEGVDVGAFNFIGVKNSKAEVRISNSNSGSTISLNVWNAADKQFMMASY
jgi:hypothetical protein